MADSTRRGFLKAAGLTGAAAIGIGATPLYRAFKPGEALKEKQAGRRLAMVIDPKVCRKKEGCGQPCVNKCHAVHNVPSFKTEHGDPIPGTEGDEIEWIWKERFANAFPEQENHHLPKETLNSTVLLLCNHCDNPPCTRVCPTKSTWKRESDGIVMMDMHRCIGCRYCMAACPYGSRSFNWREPKPYVKKKDPKFPMRTRGVVEKCNFCAERIARDKDAIPACVEAAKTEGCGAMTFGDLNDPYSEVSKKLADRHSILRKPGLGTKPSVFYLV